MASSPQKQSPEPQAMSRSGRVRKPKIFYDPSSVNAKRRSMPNMETAKIKKSSKLVEHEFEPKDEWKKPDQLVIQEKPKRNQIETANVINKRRQTVCASSFGVADDDGNGCIVCGRSDIKKGRFVNCTDCMKRGHFTCLRNDKLFKTADQEHNWQCQSCKICQHCRKVKPNEQLYKCIICLGSYHLHCSSKTAPLPKNVVKKKFTCGMCTKGQAIAKPIIQSVARSLIVNRKSDGFPGFAHEETKKIDSKNNSVEKTKIKIMPISSDATLSMNRPSTNYLKDETINKVAMEIKSISEIKREKVSPSPERELVFTESEELMSMVDDGKIIVIRKDLVQSKPDIVGTDVEKQSSNDEEMHIEYDSKTVITPHESIPDVRKWDCDEVCTYFMAKAPQYAQLLKENQIDGDALLLIKREDVLNRFNLKLGSALRLYTHIIELQYKNNNPILAWNEF